MPIDPRLLSKPENRLLLLCARGESSRGFVSALSGVRDWEYLLTGLHFNRLALLFLHLIQGYEALIPDAVLQNLETNAEQTLHWNLFLLAELQKVTRIFASNGIHVLSYKGPALAYSAYNSVSLRRFNDLDLLISPRDRNKTISMLQAAGYGKVPTKVPLFLIPYIERQKRKSAHEILMESSDGFVLLDIHWGVAAPFESFPLDFEHLWHHRVPVKAIPGAYAPSREDLILALCFHGFKHQWQILEWIGCLLNLIHKKEVVPIDWTAMEATLKSVGCERILYLALHLVGDLDALEECSTSTLQDELPEGLKQQIKKDSHLNGIRLYIWNSILKDYSSNVSSPNHFRENVLYPLFAIRVRKGWRIKGKFACGFASEFIASLERSRKLLRLLRPLT